MSSAGDVPELVVGQGFYWALFIFPGTAGLSPCLTLFCAELLEMTCEVYSVIPDVLTDGQCLPLSDNDNSQVSRWSPDNFWLAAQCIKMFERHIILNGYSHFKHILF